MALCTTCRLLHNPLERVENDRTESDLMTDAAHATPEYPFPPMPAAAALQAMRRVREDRPMTRVAFPHGGDAWVVHRYSALKKVLEDSRRFRRAALRDRAVPFFAQFPDFLKKLIVFMDPPDHSRLRRLVSQAFTPRRVDGLRRTTQAIADRLLNGMAAKGSAGDLVADFALPLPIEVISHLLGVPLSDQGRFVRWSKALVSTAGLSAAEVGAAGEALQDYLLALLARRRADPADDLLSALASVVDAEDRLSDLEIMPVAMLLIIGGFETTAAAIAGGVNALLRHPDQLAILMADIDGVIPSAVDEILRDSPFRQGILVDAFSSTPFIAVEDAEIEGVLIRAGEVVAPDFMSANHDEAAFDAPDRFDVLRATNRHMTFGHGIHFCLGQLLARMEMQVAIAALFRRFPDLALDGEAVFPFAPPPGGALSTMGSLPGWARAGEISSGMAGLPVRWGGAPA